MNVYERYPRIMEAIDCDGVILSYFEDGLGEFCAVTEVYGVFILYTQDSDGFTDLRAVTLAELNDVLVWYGFNPLEPYESVNAITLSDESRNSYEE